MHNSSAKSRIVFSNIELRRTAIKHKHFELRLLCLFSSLVMDAGSWQSVSMFLHNSTDNDTICTPQPLSTSCHTHTDNTENDIKAKQNEQKHQSANSQYEPSEIIFTQSLTNWSLLCQTGNIIRRCASQNVKKIYKITVVNIFNKHNHKTKTN